MSPEITVTDYSDDIYLDTPMVSPRYSDALQSPVFSWNDHEEDLRCAALGWFLQWRKKNDFILSKADGNFIKPVKENSVWVEMKARIIEWAWLERGGLNLRETHNILVARHTIRMQGQ